MNTSQTLQTLIDHAAATWPQRVYALDAEGAQPLTFATLAQRCGDVAALLRSQGSAPGDTVSLVMPNGLATLQWLLGAMHGGWCVNPVNLLSQPEQMRYVLHHSDCRVVVASPEWAQAVQDILVTLDRAVSLVVVAPDAAELPLPAAGAAATAATSDAAAASPTPTAEATALLMYTSGTTGVPKGVMLTQANLVANAQAISAEHALTPEDRVLAVLPLYHINAFAVTMLAPLAHGGSLAMPPKFSAGAFWAQAIARECSWINVVPTMISYLIEGAAPEREATRRIRFCRSASAALPPEHLRAFEAKFGIGIIETMGLTETVAPAFSNPLDAALRKLGSVGRASGCEAGVVDAALSAVPAGTTGEIVIRGPQVMRGYYKNDAATLESFTPDGWLRTGDLGHRDADGFFFITGRIKELIIKGGENIAPREIDEVLLRHPAVLEAAAVGIPDKHYGQEILACIVLREGGAADATADPSAEATAPAATQAADHAAIEASLREFCAQHLGRYKTPKRFRFVTELPRGPSGKVQRLKLLDSVG